MSQKPESKLLESRPITNGLDAKNAHMNTHFGRLRQEEDASVVEKMIYSKKRPFNVSSDNLGWLDCCSSGGDDESLEEVCTQCRRTSSGPKVTPLRDTIVPQPVQNACR